MVATCALFGLHVNFLDFVALPITPGLASTTRSTSRTATTTTTFPIRSRRSARAAARCSCARSPRSSATARSSSDSLAIRGFGTVSLIGEITCVLSLVLVLVPAACGAPVVPWLRTASGVGDRPPASLTLDLPHTAEPSRRSETRVESWGWSPVRDRRTGGLFERRSVDVPARRPARRRPDHAGDGERQAIVPVRDRSRRQDDAGRRARRDRGGLRTDKGFSHRPWNENGDAQRFDC